MSVPLSMAVSETMMTEKFSVEFELKSTQKITVEYGEVSNGIAILCSIQKYWNLDKRNEYRSLKRVLTLQDNPLQGTLTLQDMHARSHKIALSQIIGMSACYTPYHHFEGRIPPPMIPLERAVSYDPTPTEFDKNIVQSMASNVKTFLSGK